MNIKYCLQLNIPYKFEDVCTIRPITVTDYLTLEEVVDDLFFPYQISDELIDEAIDPNHERGIKPFDVILERDSLFEQLVLSLGFLTQSENIELIEDGVNISITVDGGQPLNRDNFDEFANVVLEIIQRKKYTKPKEEIPKFKTEEGYRRWKLLQEERAKRQRKEAEDFKLYDLINQVQFGGTSYISDDEIKKMTFWKLIKSYQTITAKSQYDDSFMVYLQCGDRKCIEKHWTELSAF